MALLKHFIGRQWGWFGVGLVLLAGSATSVEAATSSLNLATLAEGTLIASSSTGGLNIEEDSTLYAVAQSHAEGSDTGVLYASSGSVSTLTWDDCDDDDDGDHSKDIPEPTAIAGILLIGGFGIFLKRHPLTN